ncbi:MAG: hypothetical protein U9O56_01960 [Campylobacterota bacterium]|nr:hypothetical protein [Campylobacterota bacterium]
MKNCHIKLKQLIKDVVLPDIEDATDEIFEQIANSKNASAKLKEQLEEMHEMREEFNEILKEIEERTLSKDECVELIEEINEMIQDLEE